MPYCYNCGVKLDDSATFCPLCGAKVPKKNDDAKNNIENKNIEDKKKENFIYPSYSKSSGRQKITSILEIISVSFIISIISLTLINLILEGKITWSKVPSITIFFVWLILASILVFYNKVAYIFIFTFISISGYLLSLDSTDKKLSWSISYGLTILLSIFVIISILYIITRFTKKKGLNLIAYFLLGVCFICFAIDIIVRFNVVKQIEITWSKYVSFAVIPISLFLLYIHYRFSRQLPSKRVFRI